jgi:2',3'-cyclic-nucleotide 2'-phosphodiesterase (5'-nucleotidase family)
MRLTMNRVTAVLCAVGVGLLLVPTAEAAKPPPKPKPNEVKVQILSFNDYHGHLQPPTGADATLGATLDPANTPVGGSEYLSTTLTNLRANATNSITATAGDLIGGSPFLSGLFHDEPSVESLEAMRLDVSGVGNHEFDEGLTELLRMQNGGCHPADGCYFPDQPYDGANFPWLAANVVYANTGETVLPPTWTKTVEGVKVGFIGMTLEDTPVLVAQSGIVGLEFQDEVIAANDAAANLMAQGVKSIVVLLHEGGVQTGTYNGCEGISGPIVAIAQDLAPSIDLVVSGHTHLPYICNIPDPLGAPRMVTSASSFGRVVTETWLTINSRSGEVKREHTMATNHLVTRTVADPALTAIISKWNAIAAPIANRVVGSITANLRRSPNRDTESTLANVIADAQLEATAGSPANAQIALMNPGGVRADLTFSQISGTELPGEVTYGEAFGVQPFGNLLVTMTLTGAQVEAALDQQYVAGRPGGRDQLILGVSRGLTFTFSTTAPAGDRVSDVRLNGALLDPAANYQVTMNAFLADGGDAFTVFREGTNRIGGGDDLTALTNYLGRFGPVAPPEDRIAGI